MYASYSYQFTNLYFDHFVHSKLSGQVPQHVRVSIDRITGGQGAYAQDDQVYKVVLPREEATIVWDYQTLSPNLGLNSWAAFKPGIHNEGGRNKRGAAVHEPSRQAFEASPALSRKIPGQTKCRRWMHGPVALTL
jgi:hypothetical protein